VHEWVAAADAATEVGRLPLLLLHGFTASGIIWEDPQRALVSPSIVVAPDLPGHGSTDVPFDAFNYSLEGASAALERVLDASGIERAAIHGYSMGGRLALYFALTRAERVAGLSLESASAGLASASERAERCRADEELARFALERGIVAFVDRWERAPVLASQQRLPVGACARLREQRLGNRPEGLAASLRWMGTGAQPYLGERLASIRTPVAVMAGADDAKFATIARRLAAAVPHAELCLVDGAGHSPHLDQPHRWAHEIERWLARVSR
jgi:2-succinyl-6-hydroxy-2,4-cyclohexadiene-1-carboxylate synthase